MESPPPSPAGSPMMERIQSLALAHRTSLLLLAVLIRLVLVAYGSWQDERFEVKYSDVDYAVVTDAARAVYEGGSPYERHTYRYSPLLSYLLLPNIFIHPACGKLIFVLFDMLVAVFVERLVLALGHGPREACWAACVSLYNPLSMGISTRGSGDSIICALVLSTLLGLVKVRTGKNEGMWLIISAFSHGLSVHWRLYPIIFAPTILLHLKTWKHRIAFGILSGGVFFVLNVVFFLIYGQVFVQETFLYHLSRTDHRHNFSVWFYALYLGLNENAGSVLSIASFLPQVITQTALIRKFASSDITFSFLLQTWAFVVFNKVVTAQYFLWYVSLLPVALLSVDLAAKDLATLLAIPWIASELHWLVWGYRVEFLGLSSYEGVFIAGLVFFLVNIHIIVSLSRFHRERAVHDGGKKNQ